MLIAFHKPYGVLSQFTPELPGQATLAAYGFPKHVYAIGRLDHDSEGLLLLTDEAGLVDRLLNPRRGHERTYHVQVEKIPDAGALEAFSKGLVIQGKKTLPCRAEILSPQPVYGPRVPPIRVRPSVPDVWMGVTLTAGRNRQVRRMTAAMGHPTLRLLRVAIGKFPLGNLAAGEWRELSSEERRSVLE